MDVGYRLHLRYVIDRLWAPSSASCTNLAVAELLYDLGNTFWFDAGRLYHGKPSDMWALGVLLYTMLYGQFPFYDNTPNKLFRKIKAVEYSIPE